MRVHPLRSLRGVAAVAMRAAMALVASGAVLVTTASMLMSTQAVAQAKPAAKASSAQQFPDVIDVKIKARGANTFDFDVTISSPYDTPQRYADAFRVSATTGQVFGERKLLHDHADEQPFTRDLHGVTIPATIRQVVVQARDMKYGYGGKTLTVNLPGR